MGILSLTFGDLTVFIDASSLRLPQLDDRNRLSERGPFMIGRIVRSLQISASSRMRHAFVVAIAACSLNWQTIDATEVLTKSNFRLIGQFGKMNSVMGQANGERQLGQVCLFDDGLRRTYVSLFQLNMETFLEGDATQGQRIRIKQNVASGRKGIGSLQSTLGISPFDVWGRREYSVMTGRGRLDIKQGITEITPLYTRLQGLSGKYAVEMDMRLATSSIPRETLSQILRNRPQSDTADGRLEIVRLLFAADRYADAQRELGEAMMQFPELQQFEDLHETLRQKSATLLLNQIRKLQEAGQHQRVQGLLKIFPSDGVAALTLVDIRAILQQYDKTETQTKRLMARFKTLIDANKDPIEKAKASKLLEEIQAANLNADTIDRFTDFDRAQNDPAMTPDRLLALAISGWLAGVGNATDNITVATSLIDVRDLVVQYLRSNNPGERASIIAKLGRLEGGTPTNIAQLLRNMKPPIETAAQDGLPTGQFQIAIPIENGKKLIYDVQLPNEYNPYRKYPTIVSLHSATGSPAKQMEWWCGKVTPQNTRRGPATFLEGYIVITPHWARPNQRKYDYSEAEHRAVLAPLRDAMRRFSVDVDRVFLAGSSMGGDAAWDIGLAHPDMWAGVIPISATADHGRRTSPKYVSLYWEHAKLIPMYFVMGELDGKRMELNKRDFDRYLKNPRFDTLIVEYRGRGHESFFDEINRLFEWMSLHKRTLRTDEFECISKRPGDNFFWCAEVDQLPSSTLIHPIDWPQKSAGKSASTKFKKNANVKNLLTFETGAVKLTAYLSPEWVDFGEPVEIRVNGSLGKKYELVPNVTDLLEDVRQRGDRIYPFWIKIELPTGNRPS